MPVVNDPPKAEGVNCAQVQVEEKTQESQGEETPQSHDGRDEGSLDGQVNLLLKTAQKPFEGSEIDQIPADILAGYLGVPTWRAQNLQAAITDLKNNVDVKFVLLQKCQVTADWRIMFVGRKDSVMDAVSRYFRFLPEEAGVFRIEWQQKKAMLDDPKGMTGARLQKLVTEIPKNLRAILTCFDGFFDDNQGLDRLLRELPMLKGER